MQLNNWKKAENILKKGGVIVAPTDTIYGILGSALLKRSVDRIYKVRGRDKNKPCIILISSFDQLLELGIKISNEGKESLDNFWPGKVSVVFQCTSTGVKKLKYLHRGTNTLAIRMVGIRNKNLYKLLEKVGPLVAPSANPQGSKPADSISEAKKYFGNSIDIYINGGKKVSRPSTLISFTNNKIIILRQGDIKIKNK